MTIQFFGHTVTHKPQPLHRSVSIIISPAIFIYRIAYIVLRIVLRDTHPFSVVGTTKDESRTTQREIQPTNSNKAGLYCKVKRRLSMVFAIEIALLCILLAVFVKSPELVAAEAGIRG